MKYKNGLILGSLRHKLCVTVCQMLSSWRRLMGRWWAFDGWG